MTQSPSQQLPRFTKAERVTHWVFAALVMVLLLTAAALYVPAVSGLVGNRQIVRTIHEFAGFALPIPLILAVFFKAFRKDAGALNRFTKADWTWLRPKRRKAEHPPVGKFNAGQKLNAAFTLGAVIVMFGTGLIMYFAGMFTDQWRTGATFVHDWLALVMAIVIAGHLYKAFTDTTALMGMTTGSVPQAWAQTHHDAWAEEVTTAPSRPWCWRP